MALGKRAAAEPSSSISLPVTIRRAKSAKKWSANDPAKRLSLSSFTRTWAAFEQDVNSSLSDLRAPALQAISTASKAAAPHGDIVAVCVLMGTAAIAGDRAPIFDSVLSHLTGEHNISVVRLRHSGQRSVSQINSALRGKLGDGGRVALALDDADCADPEVLRDIVYLCSGIARDNKDEEGNSRLSLVIGLSTSAEPLHAALGVQESAAVAAVVVSMPRAVECLSHLVENVLTRQVHGVLVHRRVFEIIEREYFERDSTLAMILRTFKQIYSLHFLQQRLACVLSVPSNGRNSLTLDDNWNNSEKGISKRISKGVLDELRNSTASALETGEKMGGDAQLTKVATQWVCEIQRVRHTRHTAENVTWLLLKNTTVFEAGLEDRLGCKKNMMRTQLFKSFLPNGKADLKAEPAVRVIREELLRAQKHQLLKYIAVLGDGLRAHSIPSDERIVELSERLSSAEENLRSNSAPSAASAKSSEQGPGPNFKAKGSAAAQGRRRAQLLGAAAQRTPMQAKVLAVRKAVVQILEDLLSLVVPIETLPMHEGVFFSRVTDVLKVSGGIGGPAEPRHSVLSAMRDPSKYLGSLEQVKIPDTAISYQILSEGGRLVNIYDWYNSFSAVRTTHMAPDESQEVGGFDENPEVLLQAKFAKTCSELEFLGLIKHTKRKTDHVQRLVFE